jgi:hypothetical protein
MDATHGNPKQGKCEMQVHDVILRQPAYSLDDLLLSGCARRLGLERRLCCLSQRTCALALP